MAGNYVQPGKTITLTAPYAVASGAGALVGSIFGVSLQTLAIAVAGEFATVGVWSLAKTSAQAWVVGDKIYWDNANKRCDNVATAGFRLIGVATAVAANPTATGSVRLNGVTALFETAAGPAPVSLATAGAETYTAAQLLNGIIVRDCAGASRTDTLSTAALLVAAIPGAAVGDIIRCLVINGSDPITEVITLAAGTGGAFDANQTAVSRVVGGGASKLVHIRLTNVTAASEAYVIYA
jgi:predicted RecA/RadA family phage recombinase